MLRATNRLTALEVRNAKLPALLHDGGGLYLQVTAAPKREDGMPGGVRKSWLHRYLGPAGKRREMGLGSLDTVSLARARDAVTANRDLLKQGLDPIEHRRVKKAAGMLEAANAITFREAAEAFVKSKRAEWTSPKHSKLWEASLEAYAHPILGALPVASLDGSQQGVGLIRRVLDPIWSEKPETASRVRQRIEAVLDWASVCGYRTAENPARWRGRLQSIYPARSRVRAVEHRPALPFADLAPFMAQLRVLDGLGAIALDLTILTAARTNEALGARWSEIDLDAGLWTIPPERMKADREHRVPLSRQAARLLRKLRAMNPRGELVFPGLSASRPLSGMAMLMTLRRMNRANITVHGFRSCFRDWAGETTNFPRELAEAALAHTLSDKTEAAYRRGDALEKRRKLMQAWADFCDRPATAGGGKVINLRGGSG